MATLRLSVLEDFECIGPRCSDNCCSQWLMQVDEKHVALYRSAGAEFMDAIEESEYGAVMRRDALTGDCVKLCGGLCSIQAARGSDYLGDACHFYPRIPREVAGDIYVSAALSCPEMTRLALTSKAPLSFKAVDYKRLPQEIKSYLPDLQQKDMPLALVQRQLDLVEANRHQPEVAMARIVGMANHFEGAEPAQWLGIFDAYGAALPGTLAEPRPATLDMATLMQVMAGQVISSKRLRKPVVDVFKVIAGSLGVHMDWSTLHIYGEMKDSLAYERLCHRWKEADDQVHLWMARWLQAQLIAGFYPFAGLGDGVKNRTLILAMKFAFTRLALMAHLENDGVLSLDRAVNVTYLLSRAIDHLSNAQLPVNLAQQMGWHEGGRLRALVGDFDALGYLASLHLARRRSPVRAAVQAPGRQWANAQRR